MRCLDLDQRISSNGGQASIHTPFLSTSWAALVLSRQETTVGPKGPCSQAQELIAWECEPLKMSPSHQCWVRKVLPPTSTALPVFPFPFPLNNQPQVLKQFMRFGSIDCCNISCLEKKDNSWRSHNLTTPSDRGQTLCHVHGAAPSSTFRLCIWAATPIRETTHFSATPLMWMDAPHFQSD